MHTEPGAFYVFMSHNLMVLIFGATFIYAIVAIVAGAIAFWRDIGEPVASLGAPGPLWQATIDAAHLKYLDGGKGGCASRDDEPKDRRKLFHHLTFYGFALCFAATVVATGYHYLLGREAPYAWYDLPVILGTLGGIGLVIGPIGLSSPRRSAIRICSIPASTGMDVAFIFMLFATGTTGLALLVLRDTTWMGDAAGAASRRGLRAVPAAALQQVRARHLSLPRARPLRQGAEDASTDIRTVEKETDCRNCR